ncbi:MAG: cyclic nucleotide-binding domain-containing protein, partial [Bacteroidota bacterium]
MPNIDHRIARLQSSSVFHGLSRDSLEQFARLLAVEQTKAGTILMDMDMPGDKVYLIEQGRVRISRVTKYGDETTLNDLGPGEIVGELASLSGHIRSARVTVIEDAT